MTKYNDMFSHQRSLFLPWQLPTIAHSHSHSCNQNLNTKLKIRELPFADMFNLFASIIFPPWVGNAGPESGYCLLLVIGNTQCWGHIHTAQKKAWAHKISKKILYVSQIWLSSNEKFSKRGIIMRQKWGGAERKLNYAPFDLKSESIGDYEQLKLWRTVLGKG